MSTLRTLVICHDGAILDRQGLPRWLSTFSTYVGTVVIREPWSRLRQRLKREISRHGIIRFLDVLAFRFYYALGRAPRDRQWERMTLKRLFELYPQAPTAPEI